MFYNINFKLHYCKRNYRILTRGWLGVCVVVVLRMYSMYMYVLLYYYIYILECSCIVIQLKYWALLDHGEIYYNPSKVFQSFTKPVWSYILALSAWTLKKAHIVSCQEA